MADFRRIVQVLGNLMSNAERRSPDSAAIRVGAAAEGLEVAISVAAAGSEVPPEHLQHLFRKFGDPKDGGRLGRGSGLGLAICRGVVEAHGGRIRAESGPNQGIRFTFTLPTEVAVHSPAPGRRARVLVVDANPAYLHQVRRDLTDAGYAVTAVGEPEQALCLMAEQRPHLVLTSLALPGVDVNEFIQALLGVADVPVLCLSERGARPGHCTGLRGGSRRLSGQALLALGTGGPDAGGLGPTSRGPADRAVGTLHQGVIDH